MIRLLYFTGLRRQELLNLIPADINWADRTLLVRSGKGDKDRYLLIDQTTLQLTKDWIEKSTPTQAIFDISHFWSDNNFRKYCLDTGLYQAYQQRGLRLSVHSLRHAYATHRYQNGMDFFTLMTLMGHSFIDTTALYLKTATSQIDQIYAKTNPFAHWQKLDNTGQTPSNTANDEIKPDWPEALERADEFFNQPQAARPGGLPCFPSYQATHSHHIDQI